MAVGPHRAAPSLHRGAGQPVQTVGAYRRAPVLPPVVGAAGRGGGSLAARRAPPSLAEEALSSHALPSPTLRALRVGVAPPSSLAKRAPPPLPVGRDGPNARAFRERYDEMISGLVRMQDGDGGGR